MREILPKEGMWGWTRGRPQDPLPSGLGNRVRALVVHGPTPDNITIEAQGQCWTVYWWQISIGNEYSFDGGKWLPEQHPKVRRYLRTRIAGIRSLDPSQMKPEHREYWIDQYAWVLERSRLKVGVGTSGRRNLTRRKSSPKANRR
jgi:hypothetical protein